MHPVVIATLVAVACAALATWWRLRHEGTSKQQQAHDGMFLAGVTLATLLLILAIDGVERPEAYLLLCAAVICSLASIGRPLLRWSFQLVVVLGVAAAILASGQPLSAAAFDVLVLISVAVLANLLMTELWSARRDEHAASAHAQRRADLLEAVRELPGQSVDVALDLTAQATLAFGFDGAAIALIRGGALEPVRVEGGPRRLETAWQPIPPGHGIGWCAVEEDRPIISEDYGNDPRHLTDRGHVGAAVAVPVRGRGRPVGVLVGSRLQRGPFSPSAVEVVEVLAGHLGAAMDSDASMRRQRELLEQVAELDQMRSEFIQAVSTGLRDPLTVIRGVGQTLMAHPTDLDDDRREALLDRLCAQSEQLRHTIDALLDFSRFQAAGTAAEMGPVAVADLLAPIALSTGAEIHPELSELRRQRLIVHVDPAAFQHALELLVVASSTESSRATSQVTLAVEATDRGVTIKLDGHPSAASTSLVRSLVLQLLVSGGATFEDSGAPTVLLRYADCPASPVTSTMSASASSALPDAASGASS